jgi:hypothetical protein
VLWFSGECNRRGGSWKRLLNRDYLLRFGQKTMKMRNKYLWIISLLCILYSPSISTPPEYIECEDLYPDEFLDLFGMSGNSATSSVTLKHHPSVCSFSNFCPKTYSIQCHQSGKPYPQRLTSETDLSVPLRC